MKEDDKMFFSNAYDKLGVALYVIRAGTYEVIYVNAAGRRLLGDIAGKKCYQMLCNSESPCPDCGCKKFYEAKMQHLAQPDDIREDDIREEVIFSEGRYLDGIGRFVDTYSNPITLASGDFAWLNIVLDANEREKAKLAERENEKNRKEMQYLVEMQKSFIQSAKSTMTATTLDGRMIFVNAAMAETLGFSQEEILSMSVSDFHPPEIARAYFEEYIPIALREGVWRGDSIMIRRDGTHFPIRQVIFIIRDDAGKALALASIIDDITSEVAQKRELESARRMLRTIIDTVPSAIFWKDRNSIYLGANRKFAEDAGLTDYSEIEGKSDFELFSEPLAAGYVREDRHIFETQQSVLYNEERRRTCDGEMKWVSTSKVLMHDSHGEPYALLGIYDDITKIKENQARLSEAIKAAKEASSAKSNFLSRMSHEIRTPMNAILGMTRIGQGVEDLERIKYCFDKIEIASKHLLGLINDILDMSKIEAGRLELSEEPFILEKAITDVSNVVMIKAMEKNQKITLNMAENVPKQIISDEMRLSQVLTNLLSNAIKFTPENGSITLSVSFEEDEAAGKSEV